MTPGGGAEQSFAISNVAADPVTVADILLMGDVDPFDFGEGTCDIDLVLANGDSCTVSVRFTAPLAEAADYGAFLVVEGEMDGEEAVVPLLGSGDQIWGRLTLFDRTRNRLVGLSQSLYMESGRSGFPGIGSTVTLDVSTSSSRAAYAGPVSSTEPFRVVSNDCSSILPPSRTCSIVVTFEPPPVEPRGSFEPRTTSYTGRLAIGSGLGSRSIVLNGSQWHPLVPLSGAAVAKRLDRLGVALSRLVRGGPAGRLRLPVFDVDTAGALRLRLQARSGRRWFVIARAATKVRSANGKRLAFQLTRKGRALLAVDRSVRLRAKLSFTARPARTTYSRTRAFRVRR